MKISYRFVIIAALFVSSLITANVIAVKLVGLGPFVLFLIFCYCGALLH